MGKLIEETLAKAGDTVVGSIDIDNASDLDNMDKVADVIMVWLNTPAEQTHLCSAERQT